MIGRPKLGEGDTQRLQLKISEEEFKEIDNWRFENRIASRSEAVRRLVQIGMRADVRLLDIAEKHRLAFEAAVRENVLEVIEPIAEATISVADLLRDLLAFHRSATAIDELEKTMQLRDQYKAIAAERYNRESEE